MNYRKQNKNYVYVAAHRDLSASYPENTMEAFRAAAECGVDQIELDVRITKDGEAAVKDVETVDEAITCNNPDEILALLRKRCYHG